jgi:LacI family transcriptional regulator
LVVPTDLAIVSFDGTAESEFTWPALSVVRQPIEEMDAAAVASIAGNDDATATYLGFPMELIARESCGCVAVGGRSAEPHVERRAQSG